MCYAAGHGTAMKGGKGDKGGKGGPPGYQAPWATFKQDLQDQNNPYAVDVGAYNVVSKTASKGKKKKGASKGDGDKKTYGQFGNLDAEGVPIDADELEEKDKEGEKKEVKPRGSTDYGVPEHWGAKSFWDTDESAAPTLPEPVAPTPAKGGPKGQKGTGKVVPAPKKDKPAIPEGMKETVEAAKAAMAAATGEAAKEGDAAKEGAKDDPEADAKAKRLAELKKTREEGKLTPEEEAELKKLEEGEVLAETEAPAEKKKGWNRSNRWAKAKGEVNGVKRAAEDGKYWKYTPPDGKAIGIRKEPKFDAERTGANVEAGESFAVVEEKKAEEGVTFLKLADGKGWLFDRKPGVGVLCVPSTDGDAKKQCRWNGDVEMTDANEDPVEGTWMYNAAGKAAEFHIVKTDDGKLRFDGPSGTGKVSGILGNIPGFSDAWRQAVIKSGEGTTATVIGTIRLYYDKKTKLTTTNFKKNGQANWGADVKSRKIARPKVVKPPPQEAKIKPGPGGDEKPDGSAAEPAAAAAPTNGEKATPLSDEIPEGYTGPLIDKEFVEYQTLKQQPISKLKTLAKYHTVSLVGCAEKSEIVAALIAKGVADKVEVKIVKKVPAPKKKENLERKSLKEKLFKIVDKDEDQFLKRKEMQSLASVLGFDGTDAEWEEEYKKLCETAKTDLEAGIPQEVVMRLLDDESDTGLHCSEEDIWRIIGTLQARAEAAAKAEAEAKAEADKKAEEEKQAIEQARQVAFAAAVAAAQGNPGEAPPPSRPEMKRLFFLSCDKDGDKALKKLEMRTLAEASGFEGDEGEWTEEYERMCKDYGADPETGIPEAKIMSLLDDESDDGLFLDDESLLAVVCQLEEAAQSAKNVVENID